MTGIRPTRRFGGAGDAGAGDCTVCCVSSEGLKLGPPCSVRTIGLVSSGCTGVALVHWC